MNPTDLSERIMEQARELQAKAVQAAAQSAEQMKPYIEQSMKTAGELQKTLAEHAAKTASLNQEYANKALGHLSELLKIGSEALRANADQARTMAQTMVDQARKAYETTSSAARGRKGPEEGP
jgi:polyhydroxyalkanoate synthesis regulator protein